MLVAARKTYSQQGQAFYRLKQAEDAVRRWIGADLHPDFRSVGLDLTEPVDPPAQTRTIEPEVTVARAMLRRPEVGQARRSLEIDDLNIRGFTNDMRPTALRG